MNINLLSAVCILLASVKFSTQIACNHQLNATTAWKYFRSPGFPEKFPSQVQCTWRIVALPSSRVKVQFTNFKLVRRDPISGRCRLQWISIMDGDVVPKGKGVKFCGSTSPGTFVSSALDHHNRPELPHLQYVEETKCGDFGNMFLISLQSNAPYNRYDYAGFAVSYRSTGDFPHIPGETVKEHSLHQIHTHHRNDPYQEGSIQPSPYNPKLNAGQSQSDTIEELNNIRNKGRFASKNPIFDERRFPNANPRPRRTTTPSTKDIDDIQLKDSSSGPKGWSTVLIITSIFLACFVVILLVYKRRCMKSRIARKKKTQSKHNHNKNQNSKKEHLSINLSYDRKNATKIISSRSSPGQNPQLSKVETVSETIDRKQTRSKIRKKQQAETNSQKNAHPQQTCKNIKPKVTANNNLKKVYEDRQRNDRKDYTKRKIQNHTFSSGELNNTKKVKRNRRKKAGGRYQNTFTKYCESDSSTE